MHLFILGANGKTGKQLIDLALARSHQVTAFVRHPIKSRESIHGCRWYVATRLALTN